MAVAVEMMEVMDKLADVVDKLADFESSQTTNYESVCQPSPKLLI